jgi:ERCC4-related helicase
MKIVLMTATPGDTVEDVVKLMNILEIRCTKLKWNSDSNVQIDFVSVVWFRTSLVRQIKVPEGGRRHGDYVQGTGS